MRFYTTSRLSEHLEFTPEGYLLCRDVPIARIGALEYLPEEVPEEIAEGMSGPTALVYRDADELFSEATIASFEGKPVTIDHPDDFVTPDNWQELTIGHALNVRRGEGEARDLLLADLLITVQSGIDLIVPPEPEDGGEPEEPLREVSCGYDADYDVVMPGIGKQKDIIGNHIAVVPQGRCGSRCAIRDSAKALASQGIAALNNFFSKEPDMAKTKTGFWDRIMGNPKVKKAMADAAAEEQAKENAIDQQPENKAADTAAQTATDGQEIGGKLDELLIMVRSLLDALKPKDSDSTKDNGDEPDQTGDENPDDPDGKTGDTKPDDPDAEGEKTRTGDARFRMADAATIDRAAKLAPGMRFSASDSMSVVKRTSLRAAMTDKAVENIVTACLDGVPLDKAGSRSLDAAFAAASEFSRARNNDRTGQTLASAKAKDSKAKGPTSPADINKLNRQFHDSAAKKE